MNSNSSGGESTASIVYCALNASSVLVCLLAAIMVFCLNLHRKIVYRLSLYQVLSALAFSAVLTLQIIFHNYDNRSQVYSSLCMAVGFLNVYTQWVKLIFTVWVTVHLFAFVVLEKNLKKMEALYVVTSLLLPVIFAVVPLITNYYNAEPLGCYITGYNYTDRVAEIELFVLWSVPAVIILFAASGAMVVMAISLGHRAYKAGTHIPITGGNQYRNALKQLLPLIAFPILFFVFQFPILVFDIYNGKISGATSSNNVTLVGSVFLPMWSMSSAMTLVFHILLTRAHYRKRVRSLQNPHASIKERQYSTCGNTIDDEGFVYVNSATSFPLPNDSIHVHDTLK